VSQIQVLATQKALMAAATPEQPLNQMSDAAAAAAAAARQAGKAYLQQTRQQHATCSGTCPCAGFASGLEQAVRERLQLLNLGQEAEQAARQSALAQLLPQLAAQLLIHHPHQTYALENALYTFYW
jgi:hypothetical protein